MNIILSILYVVSVIVANYLSFRKAYQVTTLMGHSVGMQYPSPAPLIKHHVILLVLYMTRTFISEGVMLFTDEGSLGEHMMRLANK